MTPDIRKYHARLSATDQAICERLAGEIARGMTYLELSTNPGFMDNYVSALVLPHTDQHLFPSVLARVGVDAEVVHEGVDVRRLKRPRRHRLHRLHPGWGHDGLNG